jgi:hypothetical protein
MAGDEQQRLSIGLGRAEQTEFANLARRCSTTQRLLGVHAVRLLLASARGGVPTQTVPPSGPAEGDASAAAVYLNAEDAAALNALAASANTTPERLTLAAVQAVLSAARHGALPMLRPPESAEPALSTIELTKRGFLSSTDVFGIERRQREETWQAERNEEEMRDLLSRFNGL